MGLDANPGSFTVNRIRLATMIVASTFLAAPVGCGGKDKSGASAGKGTAKAKKRRAKPAVASADVANFDPDGILNLDKYQGSERPDDYAVEMAFNSTTETMDSCVLEYKTRNSIKPEKALTGEMEVAVKLNPHEGDALGVNAKLPGKYDEDKSLKDCIRSAAAKAPYPKYDGVPVIFAFRADLDPGMEWEEE